jgi:hypothetical protein
VIAVDTEVGCFFVSASDLEIGRNLYAGFGHDVLEGMQPVVAYLERRDRGVALRGRFLLDLGAKVATTTVAAISRFGAAHVSAFEPAPGNWALLRHKP